MRSPSRVRVWVASLAAASLAALACAARSSCAPADPPAERPLHERVNEAIDRGVAWLLAKAATARVSEVEIAHWGLIGGLRNYLGGTEIYTFPAGVTALALYTLLKCGVPPEHPLVRQGFAWIEVRHAMTQRFDGMSAWEGRGVSYREPPTSYEIAAVLLALTAKHMPEKTSAELAKKPPKIADKKDRAWAEALVKALVERRGRGSEDDGGRPLQGWRYNQVLVTTPPGAQSPEQTQVAPALPSGNQDLSSTQLAMLALFAASRLGIDVPGAVWADAAEFTLLCQEEDGPEHARPVPPGADARYAAPKDRARGFCYLPTSAEKDERMATGAMTACGVANLLMAQDAIERAKGGRKAWEARKLEARATRGIDDGIAWLDLHWSPFLNHPHASGSYDTYYLYALERAMDLMGRELVGTHPWYRDGAEELLARTRPARVRRLLDGADGEVEAVYWEERTTHVPYDVLDTCFALLFLKRSTRALAAVTGGG